MKTKEGVKKIFKKSSERRLFPRISVLILYVMLVTLLVGGIAEYGIRLSREGNGSASTMLTSQAALPLPVYRFVPGERRVYKLEYISESASDFQALFADQKPSGAKEKVAPSGLAHSFETTVQGELIATVLSKTADSVLIAYRLRQSLVHIKDKTSGQTSVAEDETIQTDLKRDIFAVVSPYGKVQSVRLDPAVGNLSQSFARALLAVTQFVLPSAQASALHQWEAQEEDANGQYIAHYQVDKVDKVEVGENKGTTADSQDTLTTFRKTKVRYLNNLQPPRKARADKFEIPVTINPKGELIARFDVSGGHLISLSGSESQVIVMAGKTVARVENTIRMNYLNTETLNPAELSAMLDASYKREKVVAAVPLSVIESKEAIEASIHRSKLGDETLESLLTELATVESSANETYDDTSLYLKFKALIYLRPESCASLGNVLATADSKSKAIHILTEALGAVGHPEAQTALVTAIRARPEDWTTLSMLFPTLGLVDSPTQLAEETLRHFAFNSPDWNIASTARLSLGIMARNLAETFPERAEKIVELFIKELGSSPSKDMTIHLLLALGNAGSFCALPTIAKFMTNPSAELRAAAALAMRWVDSSQADDLLIKALTDPDAMVRLEAVVALGFREMNAASFKAQKKAFLTDKDVKVRLEVLSNLWQKHEAFPEIHQLIFSAATKDASKEVREEAEKIIKMYPRLFESSCKS